MGTRSPSPNPSRSAGLNPKTPESINSLRKSKEIPQRSSFSKLSPSSPSLRASFEHKENEKDPSFSKPLKSRGSKNFMAPTISATSKAVPASPRKKILQERNEVITPVSDSLWKEDAARAEEDESKSEVSFGSQDLMGSFELKKKRGDEPKINNHHSVVVPSLSPFPRVSADPSVPPYDPKTNYLSPRPQFVLYRPKPRAEHNPDSEGEPLDGGDGRRLEDSFEDSSEDDVTVLTEEKNFSSSEEEFLQKEEEKDGSLEEAPVDEEKEQSLEGTPVDEEKEQSFEEIHVTEPETSPKTSKPRSSRRSTKLVPFLLVLVIGCLFAPLSDSPIISSSSSLLKDQFVRNIYTQSFEVFQDYFSVVNVNLQCLATRFKHLSNDPIAYFTSLAFPQEDNPSSYLVNMTSSVTDESMTLDVSYNHETETLKVIKENAVEWEMSKIILEEVDEVKMKAEVVDEDNKVECTTTEAKMEMVMLGLVEEGEFGAPATAPELSVDVMGENSVYEMEKITLEESLDQEEESHYSNEAVDSEHEIEREFTQSLDDSVLEPETNYCEEEGIDASSCETSEENLISRARELLKSMDDKIKLGLLLAIPVLAAATSALLYMKQKKTLVVANEKQQAGKKNVGSVSGSSKTYTYAKNHRGDEEIIGDTGPSEVSISWNNAAASSLGRNQMKREKEEQDLSSERRLRRDSTASSSMSYGSFTTFERLSAKKGNRDEEVVTPVRRSSRIRSLITSP